MLEHYDMGKPNNSHLTVTRLCQMNLYEKFRVQLGSEPIEGRRR